MDESGCYTKTAEKQLHDKGVSYEQISVVLGRQSGKLHKNFIRGLFTTTSCNTKRL